MNSKELVFHYRLDEEGYLVFGKEGASNKGGITVVARRTEKGIEYGISMCSVKDNFCKRLGREIATNRLESTPALISNEVISSYVSQVEFKFLTRESADAIRNSINVDNLSVTSIKNIVADQINLYK